MYWLMWIILAIGAAIEVYDEVLLPKRHQMLQCKYKKTYFDISVICMILMAALRYGQGTDYFAYSYLYHIDVYPFVDLVNKEPGYVFCAFMLNKMGVPFQVFVALLAIFSMCCFCHFINKYAPYKTMGLLLLYPTLYLTYIFSAFRQSAAIAIFCGFCVPCLVEKKWWKYIIGLVIAAFFHKTVLVMVILPLVCKLKYKHLCKLVIIAVLGGVILCLVDVSVPLKFILQDRAVVYAVTWGKRDISIMGIAERTFLAGFVLWNSLRCNAEDEEPIISNKKIYIAGYMLSVLVVRYSMLSSRLGVYCKALDIVLIPMLLYRMKPKRKGIIAAIILLYAFVFMYKNIASYIVQGGYNCTNVWSYPYISIFNKEALLFWRY